eukprot:gene8582-407_t
MKYTLTLCVLLVLFSFSLQYSEKITADVIANLELKGGKTDVMVELEQIDYTALAKSVDHLDWIPKGRAVYDAIRGASAKTSSNIVNFLNQKKFKYDNLWIQNTYAVFGVDMKDLEVFAKMSEVKRIWLNGVINPFEDEEFINSKDLNVSTSTDAPAWNIDYVKAPALWKLGFKGKGMVLGNADTGAHFTHEAVQKAYRGNKNGEINHNYNWFDASENSKVPVDSHGHGTHTLSTIIGGKPGKQVGVAPKAKWIHCKAFGRTGRPSNFVKCLQFFLAPHDLDGKNPKPDLRPHVTSHSYVCRSCGLLPSIQALRAAGSLFVKSCGNSGPRCSSITEPGFYKEVICAGALATRSENIASFSSRGPMNNLVKPDFATPGQGVEGAMPGASNNRYSAMSGTSMAAPCLNGAVGLLWSAVPKLKGKIDKTIEILQKSSRERSTRDCQSPSTGPNNVYGAGIIDLEKAYKLAKSL